ncbi:MAG: Crp/Fnr family transcriptional regulator [Rhizobiaceae bacterium]|nr:Crp/Fnr family transcriptional regulator [Rhizobiaceae bacterium]
MFALEDKHFNACHIFAEASLQTIAILVESATAVFCPKGKIIFAQGDPATEIAVIVTGKVGAKWISPDGREVLFNDHLPGDAAGCASVLISRPRTLSCIAVADSRIIKVSGSLLNAIIEKDRRVAANIITHLASVQRYQTQRIYEFSVYPVRHRIRLELLRLADVSAANRKTADSRALTFEIPKHQDIASKVITHREAVTRELRALSTAGIISTKRNKIRVIDLHRLRELCQI